MPKGKSDVWDDVLKALVISEDVSRGSLERIRRTVSRLSADGKQHAPLVDRVIETRSENTLAKILGVPESVLHRTVEGVAPVSDFVPDLEKKPRLKKDSENFVKPRETVRRGPKLPRKG